MGSNSNEHSDQPREEKSLNSRMSFEPVAVIGMGCRWPNESTQPSELWDFLKAGKDAYTDFPDERIKISSFYHEQRGRPGSFYSRGGCFLKDDPNNFDHTFFGINPQETTSMDPAQRKLLETVYEAFEAAGVPLEKISGSRTGCFVGNFNRDHSLKQYNDAEYPEPYSMTGSGDAILSNRVNYIFNLRGPSLTLDTACSSSLYALHLACSAIQSRDCDSAIVAGSNLILTPDVQIFSSSLGAVSPTSRCHTFDVAADGYARADGTGALYIKRLTDAIKDRDPIRAIIRGTAVNANGKTGGITRPSSEGQEAVIRHAYQRSGLNPALTGYVECHGTGTPVGDPLEISAIGCVFAEGRSKTDPLLVGSIKSNIGHTEPSSGIAGVMKVVLALENGTIPRNVGYKTLNPQIDLKDDRLKIVTENLPWPKASIRRASVNSFGYGGSNAHLIIDAPTSLLPGYKCTMADPAVSQSSVNDTLSMSPTGITGTNGGFWGENTLDKVGNHQYTKRQRRRNFRQHFLLVFSAHNERTLKKCFEAFHKVKSMYKLADLAYTLAVRRSTFAHRYFAVATEGEVEKVLPSESIVMHSIKRSKSVMLAFLFTGQGAQWSKMGSDLMQNFPSYLDTIRRLDNVLSRLKDPPSWTLEDVFLAGGQDIMKQAAVAQPATTALQIALVNLMISWNIKPAAAVGHSSGEIGAAYASGLISMEEAIIIAFLRGKAASQNEIKGLMLAVGAGEEQVRRIIGGHTRNITIACHNSPQSVTLSGGTNEILAIESVFRAENIFTRLLETGENAYHSAHMCELGPTYEAQITENCGHLLSPLHLLPKTVFVSSVTADRQDSEVTEAAYWKRNLESPVLFQEAIRKLIQITHLDVVIEIGPHAALKSAFEQIAAFSQDAEFPQYFPTLFREKNSVINILGTAGNLWARGYSIDLGRVNLSVSIQPDGSTKGDYGNVIADLPRYQWQYEMPLTRENRWTREWRLRSHARHDILGSRVPGLAKSMPTWRNIITPNHLGWLNDHRLDSEMVFPAAGYICMAIEAITQAWEIDRKRTHDIEAFVLHDIHFKTALVVPDNDRGIEVLFNLQPLALERTRSHKTSHRWLVTSVVRSGDDDIFVEHAYGLVGIAPVVADEIYTPRHVCVPNEPKSFFAAKNWYESFARVGMNYGPLFRGLTHIRNSKNGMEANIHLGLGHNPAESRYAIHPTALDAFLQSSIIASHSALSIQLKSRFMPVSFESIAVRRHSQLDLETPGLVEATGRKEGGRRLAADLWMKSASGKPLVDVRKLQLVTPDPLISPQNASTSIGTNLPYTRVIWKPDFDYLTSTNVAGLYPPLVLDKTSVAPQLNYLALHQLVQFHTTYPEYFEHIFQQPPHLQHFLEWTISKIRLARTNQHHKFSHVIGQSTTERAERIQTLCSTLNTYSAESRTMCKIYDNLPSILSGEKSGIQVALQDNMLSEMYESGQIIHEGNRRLAAITSLLSHRKCDMRILEVGAGTGSATMEILPALNGESLYRKYKDYLYTDITPSFLRSAEEKFSMFKGLRFKTFDMQYPATDQGFEANIDLVVASNVVHASSDILTTMRNLRAVLKTGGKIILLEITQPALFTGLLLGTFSDFWNGSLDPNFARHDGPFLDKESWKKLLVQAGFSGIDFMLDDFAAQPSSTVIVGTAIAVCGLPVQLDVPKVDGLTIVYRNTPTRLLSVFEHFAISKGMPLDITSLSNPQPAKYTQQLFLADTDAPLFSDINSNEWLKLRVILQQATCILWVTNGGLISGRQPLFSIIAGIVRALKTERHSLRISTLDLDHDLDSGSLDDICNTIYDLLETLRDDGIDDYNLEFRQKNGVIYRSSLQPDDVLNRTWRSKGQTQMTIESLPLENFKDTGLSLEVDSGSPKTVSFKPDVFFNEPLSEDCVEVCISAIDMGSNAIAALKGNCNFNEILHGCSGVIRHVGRKVNDLMPGDRVCGVAFGAFGNIARIKASFCQKFNMSSSFEEAATVPIPFCSAAYGLIDLARLAQGESVLIHAGNDSVIWAVVQISKLCGAEIYVTVSSKEYKQEVLNSGLGLPEDHVFWLREGNIAESILDRTGGKGVDVIFSCVHGEVPDFYSQCVNALPRIIELQEKSPPYRQFDMTMLQRKSATTSSFNIEAVAQAKPAIITSLMSTTMHYYREGLVKPLPATTFQASEVEEAIMFDTRDKATLSKAVVLFTNGSSMIKFREPCRQTKFDPAATYLLVGCLGGLGQLYSRWMVEMGAKSLAYLSRSGNDKEDTQAFVSELESNDVEVLIVRGDVSQLDDVKRVVAATRKPIKGVVQAALTLQDSSLETMTLEMFEATLKPRVIGTLNLHEATLRSPLDFFMMWSSWTAIFGTGAQANYLSSCTFMDAFARHRKSLGLPATSLSLNRIGTAGRWVKGLRPDYTIALSRNGIYGNSVDDFIQYCETAIRRGIGSDTCEDDPLASAHVLAGIEPQGLWELNRTHPLEDMSWHHDERFSNLLQAVDVLSSQQEHLPSDASQETGKTESTPGLSATERIHKRLAHLLYISEDEVETRRALSEYGIDSMIAGELRNWIFKVFRKDVSTFSLLNPGMTVEKLGLEIDGRAN